MQPVDKYPWGFTAPYLVAVHGEYIFHIPNTVGPIGCDFLQGSNALTPLILPSCDPVKYSRLQTILLCGACDGANEGGSAFNSAFKMRKIT
jgi:hypothetical protein